MISSESKKGKKLHIEFLRFFCIWLVMFTHTSTAGFSLYLLRPESFFFPFYIAVPFWVKTAVPIFFMISGALLLKKEEPISVIFKKRIWRFAQNIIEELRPIREKRAYYEAHPEEVDKILIEGTEKARKVAKETMKKVKKAMMLDYFEED